jgi:hypothetical protein
VVRDARDVGAGCLQHRTVFITYYKQLLLKSTTER